MVRERSEQQIDRYNRYGSPLQWLAGLVVGLSSGAGTFINVTRTKFHDDGKFRQGSAIIYDVKGVQLSESWNTMLNSTYTHFAAELKGDKYFKAFTKARENIMEHRTPLTNEGMKKFRDLEKEYVRTLKDLLEHRKDEMREVTKTPAFKKTISEHLGDAGKIKGEFDHLGDDFNELFLGIKSHGFRGHTEGAWQRLKNFSHYANRNVLLKTGAAIAAGFGATMMVFNQLNNRDKLNEIDKQTELSDRKIDALMTKVGVEDGEIKTRLEKKLELRSGQRHEGDPHMRMPTHDVPSLSVAPGERSVDRLQHDVGAELGA